MSSRPRLSEVRSHKLKCQPGDRLLVRLPFSPTADQAHRIKKSVSKFAGEDVRVLLVNCMLSRMTHVRGGAVKTISGPQHAEMQNMRLGTANLSCSVIDFQPDDRLVVFVPKRSSETARKTLEDRLRAWVGKYVEIQIESSMYWSPTEELEWPTPT